MAGNAYAGGIETWFYENSLDGAYLASTVQLSLVRITEARDRGIKASTKLYVLKNTNMPAILVECGFMSNKDELKKLTSESYQRLIAYAISAAIGNYLRGDKK